MVSETLEVTIRIAVPCFWISRRAFKIFILQNISPFASGWMQIMTRGLRRFSVPLSSPDSGVRGRTLHGGLSPHIPPRRRPPERAKEERGTPPGSPPLPPAGQQEGKAEKAARPLPTPQAALSARPASGRRGDTIRNSLAPSFSGTVYRQGKKGKTPLSGRFLRVQRGEKAWGELNPITSVGRPPPLQQQGRASTTRRPPVLHPALTPSTGKG